jgi:hypothetical protein
VGTDGRDDIAAGTFQPTVQYLSSWERGVPDYVLMLDPSSAATQPATTAPGPVSAPAPL